MKVSTRGRYGLRIMMELALREGAGPVQVTAVARNQGLPAKYIHVLVGGLKAAGLVTAQRGPSGGLELAREASRITALDVVEALEGPVRPVDCDAGPEGCKRSDACVTREVWREMGEAMEAVLRRHTLADLAERMRAASAGGDAWMI
ncbi:RrF2 family transcriptional regulator [Mesoterricola sediminis]|uniref:AsnC family transcriptional regulator n=1 Tax=Mesoterricola sediminis TaxID=2927980 RepID=A0AA48KFR3_9BACT|nr:Rrf2 family transcriptional regulator [Mesoterricola sediminis]BDU78562.1 AsnC family transcriptional regulator [Mesoterricola sediminis]